MGPTALSGPNSGNEERSTTVRVHAQPNQTRPYLDDLRDFPSPSPSAVLQFSFCSSPSPSPSPSHGNCQGVVFTGTGWTVLSPFPRRLVRLSRLCLCALCASVVDVCGVVVVVVTSCRSITTHVLYTFSSTEVGGPQVGGRWMEVRSDRRALGSMLGGDC